MKEQTPNYATMAYGLLDAATNLSNILDWSADKHGFVKVLFKDAAELILAMQRRAKEAADEFLYIKEYGKEVNNEEV